MLALAIGIKKEPKTRDSIAGKVNMYGQVLVKNVNANSHNQTRHTLPKQSRDQASNAHNDRRYLLGSSGRLYL